MRVLGILQKNFPVTSVAVIVKNAMPDGAPPGFRNVFLGALRRSVRGATPEEIYGMYSRNAVEWGVPVVSDRGAGFAIKVLAPLLPTVLGTVLDMFSNAAPRLSAFNEASTSTISGARRGTRSARAIAIDAALERLYPRTGAFRSPDADRLGIVSFDDVARFAREALTADNLVVTAAGDFDWRALLAEVDARLGKLPRGVIPWPAPEPSAAAGSLLIPNPTPQPVVVLAFRGPATNHPDRSAMTLAQVALNRYLYRSLRITEGITYGSAVSLYAGRDAPPAILTTTVERGGVGKAIDGVFEAIAKVGAMDETDLELARALAQPALVDHSGVSEMVGDLDWLGANNLGATWFTDRARELDGVTAADVTRVVRNYFRRETLQLVVVGDVSGLAAQLETRKLGPVVTRE